MISRAPAFQYGALTQRRIVNFRKSDIVLEPISKFPTAVDPL